MNLYRGCSHGCIYCDSRSKCYHIEHDFEDIQSKENTLELLENALKRKRSKCMLGTGSMTAPYIPLESEIGNVRKALSLVYQYGFGFTLITKSNRVLRDLDLIKAINEKTKCVVQMTLTTYDEDLCKKIDPNVCTTRERFQALKQLRDAGIPTVVWLCPILPFSEKTVGNYMRQMGIKDQWVKPYIQTTIDSDFSQKLKNIFNEEFNPAHPDAVWCSDITYIWTLQGFVYLTSVMDLYSRKIISWVLSETLEASHVVECMEKAKSVRNVEKPLIFHCDRGCPYVSEAFQKATTGMIHSDSKKAYPWDNACIESFHALLKRE